MNGADRRGASGWLAQVTFVIALFGGWFLVASYGRVNKLLLPDLRNVLVEFGNIISSRELLNDLQVTMSEVGIAYCGAVVFGIISGFLISRSELAIAVIQPVLTAIYSIPIILFLPLFVLILGIGPPSKIAIGGMISFFPIVFHTISGLSSVDETFVKAARSLGASRRQLLLQVLIPASLPVVVAGLRVGFTLALLSIIGSETIASFSGLGHRVVQLAEGMETAKMFAYVMIVALIAIFMNAAISKLTSSFRVP